MKTFISTKQIIVTMMAASASLLSAQVFASGYGLHEVSPSLMGNAYAGNATSDEDISGMRFNPAILAMADDHQIYLSGTGIFPEIDASNVRSNTTGVVPALGPFGGFSFSEGPTKASDIGNDAFVPAAFFAYHVNDAINLGLAITAPWGLSTEYDRDWTGRYFGIRSDLESVNINPMASLRFDEHFSVAVGFQAQYLNANLTQKVQYQDKIGFIPEGPFEIPFVAGYDDIYSRVKGHGWGYGWSLGGLYEFTEDTRIGLGWQSRLNTEIKGNAEAIGTSDPSDEFASENLIGKANTHITTPDVVSLGISHDIDPCWTVMANVEWTHWTLFRDLHIQIDNNAGGQTDTVVYENWENTYFYSIGADFRPMEDLVLRAGIGYDQSPVDAEHRNPTVPDSDRNIFSVGAGYELTDDLRIDVAYMYLRFHDSNVNQDIPVNADQSKSLEAEYAGHVNLVSLGLEYVF